MNYSCADITGPILANVHTTLLYDVFDLYFALGQL